MNEKNKQTVTSVAGFCGGGVFCVLNILTDGAVPGGFVGGILGFLVFAGPAALILHFLGSKPQN